MIESYLLQSEHLKGAVLIVDSRHTPTRHDIHMREWLQVYDIPLIIVATKIDKIPKTKQAKQLKNVAETLKIPQGEQVLPFSALTGKGVQAVWQAIFQLSRIPT